jgi:CheY-like chemotaxis protein
MEYSMSYILIIEDDAQNARLAEKLLINAGHTVTKHETGEEGLQKALSNTPKLLLIDLGLPDIDGQTVIAILRQQPHLQKLPIVAFTAYPKEVALQMAKTYGCNGVILKPIDTRTFAEQIQAILKQSE